MLNFENKDHQQLP